MGVRAERVMLVAETGGGSGMVWLWGAIESYGAEMDVIGSACKTWEDSKSQLKPRWTPCQAQSAARESSLR